jgi:response regulator RpfG family c-di-GMP phosphodiesterase
LDIAEGLKQLLIDADITIESIVGLSYRELSKMLHIDLYVSELIVEAVQKFVQERNLRQENYNGKAPDKKTIMICDDEQDVLQLFGQALKSKYNIIMFSSGEDCIDRFIKEKNQGNKIHLILLDYRLGDIMGDSVARTIKEYNGTKIILISAYDLDSELINELKEDSYIAKYIEKPIHIANLIEIVANTIS